MLFWLLTACFPYCKASRLREEAHTMGSICMAENCTELKNLRSLVRVCEIQATLREQRYVEKGDCPEMTWQPSELCIRVLNDFFFLFLSPGYCF